MNYPPLQPGLALDIDETLSVTGIAWLEQYAKQYGNPEHLDMQEALQRFYYQKEEVNNWNRQHLVEYMLERATCNETQKTLPLIENANHIVEKIHTILPISCYITARPTSVIEGTQHWLNKHGFPDLPVITRPTELCHTKGNLWKAGVLMELSSTICGIVDDNPNLIEHLPEEYDGTVFLYSHTEYNKPTKISVVPCENWEDVYTQIKKGAVTQPHSS